MSEIFRELASQRIGANVYQLTRTLIKKPGLIINDNN